MSFPTRRMAGISYVELLVAMAVAALLLAGISGVVGQALRTRDQVQGTQNTLRQARFAMQRMVRAVRMTSGLMLPAPDDPHTAWPDNVRDSSVPGHGRAVLAVRLPAESDLDTNGVPDADDDGDGRIDEDRPADQENDGASGILGIDDDGDGQVDEANADDDDEDVATDEDPLDGVDNDGDGRVDEDAGADNQDDGGSGLAGVDDDGDQNVDEDAAADNDEDGRSGEDPLNPLLFYWQNETLFERRPAPWDTDGDGDVDGADFVLSPLVAQVGRFRVERIAGDGRARVDLLLEVTDPGTGKVMSLRTQVRVGSGL